MAADYSQKTSFVRKEDAQRNWHIIDAEGQVLGRLAQEIATLMMGKHKADYTPHVDGGDFVVVLNAGKVAVTGKKYAEKEYDRNTGYPSGRRVETFESLNTRRPGEPLRLAVKRMLPKNNLGRRMILKLKLYAGTEHPHGAQQPKVYVPQGRGTEIRA
jgi:large subunit ribosomal protein L13